jgi:hypothetical protein
VTASDAQKLNLNLKPNQSLLGTHAAMSRNRGGGGGQLLVVAAALVFAALVLGGGGLWWNALRLTSRQHPPAGPAVLGGSGSGVGVDVALPAFERQLQREPDAVVRRLAESIRFRTISHDSNHNGTSAALLLCVRVCVCVAPPPVTAAALEGNATDLTTCCGCGGRRRRGAECAGRGREGV